jgi:hypothetical protein
MFSWLERSFRIEKAVLGVVACVLFSAGCLFAQGEQIFKGQITRCTCARPDERAATSDRGANMAPCSTACASKGAKYVLTDTKNSAVYQLDKQRKSKAFAGQYVMVLGTLNKATGTIHVGDIVHALPPKVTGARSVFIYCDACPRGMANAKLAAFEELEGWNRFDVLDDPTKADLIFLFSANPYLGDYVTRDGPDRRPVSVDITYMNVVDPHTGEDLWGDSKQWGSMLVGKATRDLIAEFREQLEEETHTNLQSLPGKHGNRKVSPVAGN